MLEFAVPDDAYGTLTFKLNGSFAVPVGYVQSAVGWTTQFVVTVAAAGLDILTVPETLFTAPMTSGTEFALSADLEVGAPSAGRSIYLKYRSFDNVAACCALYSVTLSSRAVPRRTSIASRTGGSRGRFL